MPANFSVSRISGAWPNTGKYITRREEQAWAAAVCELGATNDAGTWLVTPNKKLTSRQLYQAFRDTAGPLPHEPLPEHWIELIHRIDQKEREGLDPQAKSSAARGKN
jgi:hypothetical protein